MSVGIEDAIEYWADNSEDDEFDEIVYVEPNGDLTEISDEVRRRRNEILWEEW